MGPRGNPVSPVHPNDGPARWIPPLAMAAFVIALVVSSALPGWAGGSPLLWYGLVAYVALRHRRRPWVPTLLVPATLFFVLWFAQAAPGIVLPFLFGLLAAYLLDPLVDRLQGRLGRTRAVALVLGPIYLFLALATWFALPVLLAQLVQLLSQLPEAQEPLQRAAAWIAARAQQVGIELQSQQVVEQLLPRVDDLGRVLGNAGQGVWQGVQGAMAVLGFVVITPVIGFYLLRDYDELREGALGLVPDSRRQGVAEFFHRVDRAISGHLRGQLIVGAVVGLAYGVALTVLGVDYALIVGLAALLLNLVPFVGSFLTALLALGAAVLTDPTGGLVLPVAILYAVVQALDAAVLSPRVMGDELELHPVAVMVALLVGGQFLGPTGLLIAVPAAAVLKEGARRWATNIMDLLPSADEEAP